MPTKPKTTARPPLRLIDCAKQRREEQQRYTADILTALLRRALKGEVQGLVCWFMESPGVEHMVATGPYKASRAEAMNAAARMSYRLAQLQDEK